MLQSLQLHYLAASTRTVFSEGATEKVPRCTPISVCVHHPRSLGGLNLDYSHLQYYGIQL